MARQTYNDDREIADAERRLGIGRPRKGESLAHFLERAARYAKQTDQSIPASLAERVYRDHEVRRLAAMDRPLSNRDERGRYRQIPDHERRTYAAEVAKRIGAQVGGRDGERVVIGGNAFDPVAAPRLRLLREQERQTKAALDRAAGTAGAAAAKREHDRVRQARLRWEKSGAPSTYTTSRLADTRPGTPPVRRAQETDAQRTARIQAEKQARTQYGQAARRRERRAS